MGIIKKYMSSFKKPEGAVGRFILNGMNIGHAPVSRYALSHFEIKPDDHILDIGCGGGANIRRMLKKAYNGKVYGADHAEASVRMSREKNADTLGERCEIVRAGADNLPYANNTFDTITAFETIYFWKDIDKCFSEINRVLKDNGIFVIGCETYKGGDFWSKIVDGMTVYSSEKLKEMLARTGFRNIKIYTRFSYLCVTAEKKTTAEKD